MTDSVSDLLVKKSALEITYDYEYVGPVGTPERKRVERPERITHVRFGLSPQDWCDLCMRDGQYYMGSCCGNTSQIQDVYNGIFRDGGSADAHTVFELMEMAAHHEGFEIYTEKFDKEKLPELLEKWDELSPIDKIGVCCQSVKDRLKPTRMEQPMTRPQEPDDFLSILEYSLRLISYQDVFGRDKGAEKSGQHHANVELLLARAVPAAKKFLDASVPFLSKPFEGFAIVKKGTEEIQSNHLGLCIYRFEKHAQEAVDLWKRARDGARDDEKDEFTKHLESVEIRPIAISAFSGIVWRKV